MAIVVPRVDGPSVQREGIPSVRLNDTPPDSSGLERGLANLGAAVTQIAQREQERADMAQVLEAKRKLGDWERAWFDPNNETGVYSQKGRDALGVNDKLDSDFQRVSAEISGNIRSPRARQAFMELSVSTRDSVLGRAQTYAVSEHDKYVKAEFQASMLQSTEAAGRAGLEGRYEDQAREVRYGLGMIRATAKTEGEPPELTRQKEQTFLSSVHATALKGLIDAGEIDQATAYMDENGESMTVEDAGAVTARLRPMQVELLADTMVYGVQAGVTPADLGADLTLADIWPAQERQESGGNQRAVSVKGAVGVAQIMPATGPEAARLAGLPWDAKRLKTDADYNRALGQAYMGEQLRVFGSMPLALAAYNAGPGAVQKWIRTIGDPRRGDLPVAEFVNRIPYSETRDYVTRIYKGAGRDLTSAPTAARPRGGAGGVVPSVASAPAPGATRTATLAQQLAQVREIPDPLLRRTLEQKVRSKHALEKQQEAETEALALEAINTKVWDAPVGQPLSTTLSTDEVAFITQRGYRDRYEETVRKRIEGALPQTDAILFDTLRRQSVEDPSGFMAQRNFILKNRDKFAAPDYETLLGRIKTLQTGKSAAQADWATQEQRKAAIAQGLELKGKAQIAAVGMAYDQAERALIQTLDGKKPTPEQLDALARNVRVNIARNIANDVPWVDRYGAYEAEAVKITPARRSTIQAGLTRALGRQPTDAEILQYEAGRVSRQAP